MELHFALGATSFGIPVRWDTGENPHAYITGRSGSGKSCFLHGMVEQAARQGATCLVMNYSADFCEYCPPEDIHYTHIGITNPVL